MSDGVYQEHQSCATAVCKLFLTKHMLFCVCVYVCDCVTDRCDSLSTQTYGRICHMCERAPDEQAVPCCLMLTTTMPLDYHNIRV